MYGLLVITKVTYKDHLSKLRQVLLHLQDVNLRVNGNRSFFAIDEVKYLGYVLSRDGIKPMPGKVSAILVSEAHFYVKEFQKILEVVQYYRDLGRRKVICWPHFLT